ncbi:hypothetical protein [Paenibacillus sp. GXUN7292]|uniref:hypothetical protein n=1 Tax=Paenibacillus sp. GXUN7292 TaxID=3422499 RepID=UPI003D7DCDCF
MTTKDDNAELAQMAQEIIDALARVDREVITKMISHSHQIHEDAQRKATMSGKSDKISWDAEIIKNDFAKLEQLFKEEAYNTLDSKAIFINTYTKIIKMDKSNQD